LKGDDGDKMWDIKMMMEHYVPLGADQGCLAGGPRLVPPLLPPSERQPYMISGGGPGTNWQA